MDFRIIKEYPEITTAISRIKRKAKEKGIKVHTNYFPNTDLHTDWISRSEFEIMEDEGFILLKHHRELVDEYFFASADDDELCRHVRQKILSNPQPSVFEQIGGGVINLLPVRRRLMRMRRASESVNRPTSDTGQTVKAVTGNKTDIEKIRNILIDSFDVVSDRIPSEEELRTLASTGGILKIEDDNKIQGILIYESGKSSYHLRYWWSSPEQRGKGTGGLLLKEFLRKSEVAGRQHLWVDQSNLNAIERYRHYGFKEDGTVDVIQSNVI